MQKIILWIGIAIFVLMGLFPPWFLPNTLRGSDGTIINRKNLGYKFIYNPPKVIKDEGIGYFAGASIDFQRLAVQWVMIVVVTGGLIITFKNKKAPFRGA